MPTSPPPLPSRYTCLHRLGTGTTAQVYLARDEVNQQQVAFKVVRQNLALHRRFRARFAREVSLSARLVHPHLVPVHDAGTLSDGRPFVAMAYADQGNLSDLLRQGLRTTRLLKLCEQVCRALAALHSRGFLHLDLKPENVLVHTDSEGQPAAWLSDLGIADEVSDLLRSAQRSAGTPTFMAPEQLRGHTQELGPWTDLFAVGLILHEALGGVREDSMLPAELLDLRLRGMPELEPQRGIPEELIVLVRNLLDPEPRQRYDRAADVRRLIRAIRKSMAEDDPELRLDLSDGEWSMMDQTGPLPGEAFVEEEPEAPVALRWNRVPPGRLPKTPPLRPPAAPPPASLALLALRERPLEERDAEVLEVWSQAHEVVDTQSARVVLLTGGAGSGKTAFARNIGRVLEEGGWMDVVTLRYHEPPSADDGSTGAVSGLLLPWQDTTQDLQDRLCRWIARDRETTLDRVKNEARVLTRWCGHSGEGPPPDAAVGLHYLVRHLDRRAWRGGSCLILDDAHLAQELGEGLSLAEAILEGAMGRRPLLVVVTLDSEALEGSLAERVDSLVSRGATRIELQPLGAEAAQRMLEKSYQVAPELAERLAHYMPNHPFYAGALLRDLAARGHLDTTEAGELVLKEGKQLANLIPPSLEKLFSSRLQAALYAAEDNEAANLALAAIALAGPRPPVAVIKHISEGGVDSLMASGLVLQEAGMLRFEEQRLRAVAIDHAHKHANVPAIHASLAQGWAALGERTGAIVDLPLGRHRLRAGQHRRAVPLLLRSARHLLASNRYAAAGRAAGLAGEAADALDTLSQRQEARRLQAEALLGLERTDEALEKVREARQLGKGERLVRARMVSLEARINLELGRSERAAELAESAFQGFWALRDREGQAEVALLRGQLARAENRLKDAVEQFELVLSHRPVWHPSTVAALSALAELCLHQGQPKRARRAVHHLADAARRTGNTRISSAANFAAGRVMLAEGHYEEADRLFQSSRANAAAAGEVRMQLNALNGRGEVARLRGQVERARQIYETYGSLAHAKGFFLLEAVSIINRALLALNGSDLHQAETLAIQAAQVMATRPRSWLWLHIAMIRAAAAAQAGDLDRTTQWWELARERGLEDVRTSDLYGPLRLVSQSAERHGWADLQASASRILARIAR